MVNVLKMELEKKRINLKNADHRFPELTQV